MCTEKVDRIVYSIVSHGQLSLICSLLLDFRKVMTPGAEIFIVLNIPESEACLDEFGDLPITVLRNASPMGFGANHNQVFRVARSDYFIVVNPDIRFQSLDVALLLKPLTGSDVGAVAPSVLSPDGKVEDSVRRFPSFSRLAERVLLGRRTSDYHWKNDPIEVDWSAGMFVAFDSEAYALVGGFDDRYFMYLEDADICRRLKDAGLRTLLQPAVAVVHDARRASRRSIRHLTWHLSSVFRFLLLSERNI